MNLPEILLLFTLNNNDKTANLPFRNLFIQCLRMRVCPDTQRQTSDNYQH